MIAMEGQPVRMMRATADRERFVELLAPSVGRLGRFTVINLTILFCVPLRGTVTAGEIAERVRVTRRTVSNALVKFSGEGLVRCEQPGRNGAASLWSITDAGRGLFV